MMDELITPPSPAGNPLLAGYANKPVSPPFREDIKTLAALTARTNGEESTRSSQIVYIGAIFENS
jgi:hypothetical protein